MSERTYTTDGIVLRARNLGEADRIFTLFTVARGKLDAVGKGTRRLKSTVGGQLQFLSEATLTFHRGRNLDVITSAQTVRSNWLRLVEPATFAAASLLAEIVDSFCEPDLPMPEIYELLAGAAVALGASANPAGLVPRFQLRLLSALGLAPPDDACVRCSAEFSAHGAWLDVEAGGLACERCCGMRGDGDRLDAADVANFRAVGAMRGGAVKAAATATPRAARAIDRLVIYHLGKRPKSRALLDAFPT
ncbi:MAG: DNA repair protein RecO [Candidatus Velthaea sp.]